LAEAEADRFAQALGGQLVTIHAIGSTSIAGIWAKPILDLMPEVVSLEALDARRSQIEALGFEYWGEYGLPGRRFCPRHRDGIRRANVHCYASGHPDLIRHLNFRDYLRAHPEVALAYQAEKLRCRDLCPNDVQAYTDCKSDWIRATERAALAWRQASSDRPRS
jgi:GrpB-like predicted nucleotidyltransferase (UPF0157 family)